MSTTINRFIQLHSFSMRKENAVADQQEVLRKRIEEVACLELENYRKYQKYKQSQEPCDFIQVYNPVNALGSHPVHETISSTMEEVESKSTRATNTDIEIDDIDPIDAFYQDVAFFCVPKTSIFRKWAIKFTLSPYFERVTMFIIFMNCITLGLYDPYDEHCKTTKCQILEYLETFIYAYFLAEMLVKIIAFGFFGKLGYISEAWNKLDFFIVLAGTFEILYGDGEFLSSVRAVRVLRPLRAINRVPSIRILVTLLLDTLPMLGNVFILCVLILMVFAIIGVQLWQGLLRNRCYLDLPVNSTAYYKSLSYNLSDYYIKEGGDYWSFICSSPVNNGEVSCSSASLKKPFQTPDGKTCSMSYDAYVNQTFLNQTFVNKTDCVDWNMYYSKCEPFDKNPHYGAISFDNAGVAFIAIFQSITLEGWADIMYYLQDAYSSWVWVYFVVLIVLGSYFLTNLCLVVVATQFSETRQRESALMDAAKAKRRAKSTSSTTFTISEGGDKGCYNQILSILHHYIKRACRRLKRRLFGRKDEKSLSKRKHLKKENNDNGSVHFHHHHHHHIHHHHLHLCPNSNTVDTNVNNNENKLNDVRKPSSVKSVLPPPPAICIDDMTDTDAANPIQKLPVNTTALIIPDTTVVICHSSSLPDSLKTQSPLANVALYPPLPKVRKSSHDSANCAESLSLGTSYRSVGDVNCCNSDLTKEELDIFEKRTSDYDSYSSDDDDDDERKQSCCKQKRAMIKTWCEANCFKVFIMVSIFLNTVTMAIEHYEQSEDLTFALDIFNTIFTTIFTIEMLMKLTGHGFYGYIKDAFNLFDGIIVIISLVELFGDSEGGVSVLRTFRLMRVFKLVRFLPTLQKQIQVMLETLDSVMTFLGLLTIFIFTSSILGMHLFGGKMKEQDSSEPVRHNFDNLLWSLITVFQVLTQEDWNQVLYDAMRCTTKWASVYFIFLMIIGNYVLFNLLVAILVEGFSTETEGILSSPLKSPLMASRICSADDENCDEEGYSYHSPYKAYAKSLPNIFDKQLMIENTTNHDDVSEEVEHKLDRQRSVSESAIYRQVRFSEAVQVTSPLALSPTVDMRKKLIDEEAVFYEDKRAKPTKVAVQSSCCCSICYRRKDWSLFFFSPDSKYRKNVQDLVSNPWFDNVILFFILLNCVIMAMERPSIKPESTERKFIDYSNNVFTVVFFIEMCLKIFACGFICGDKNTYLKNNWNRIDFVLVIVSLVDIIVTYIVQTKSGVLGMLKVFRAFRTLRPLRVISRAPGLKIVVETLIASLAPIGNLLVVALVFFTIFGILGVQLFKGKFHYCSKDTLPGGQQIFNRTECVGANYNWVNKKYNFDNLLQALFTLFVFATKDGWVTLMYDGIDAVGPDMQPRKNYNPWAFLYFVSFLLIAGFVVINMVVGVIIDNFQKCRVIVENEMDEAGIEQHNESIDSHVCGNASIVPTIHSSTVIHSSASLHETVTSSVPVKKKVTIIVAGDTSNSASSTRSSRKKGTKESNYEIPHDLDEYSYARKRIFYFVSHYRFDLVIAVVIGLNVLFMALEFYQMPKDLISFLKIMNYIFTAVFILEAILKIIGFGARLFFAQRWNQLDIVIVFLSIIGIIFEELDSSLPINPTIIRIMRVLRIARVLKILKAADGIQKLLNCVSESLPQVGNLSMLFLLIFFIFSALGIELFGGLDCDLDECYGISRHAHFNNFGYALLTLFRISTGDNWSGILKDCINSKLCPESCPMMPIIAPIYFAVFVLASQFVLVNVVVAVLMKQLEDAKLSESPPGSINDEPYDPKEAKNDIDSLNQDSKQNSSISENRPLLNSTREDNLSENYSMTANLDVFEFDKESLELNNLGNSNFDHLSIDEFSLGPRDVHSAISSCAIRDNKDDSLVPYKERLQTSFANSQDSIHSIFNADNQPIKTAASVISINAFPITTLALSSNGRNSPTDEMPFKSKSGNSNPTISRSIPSIYDQLDEQLYETSMKKNPEIFKKNTLDLQISSKENPSNIDGELNKKDTVCNSEGKLISKTPNIPFAAEDKLSSEKVNLNGYLTTSEENKSINDTHDVIHTLSSDLEISDYHDHVSMEPVTESVESLRSSSV